MTHSPPDRSARHIAPEKILEMAVGIDESQA